MRSIKLEGLQRVSRTLVENQIRLSVGGPYLSETVRQDVRNLTRLNQFRLILPSVAPDPAGGVDVTYQFQEWPLAADIQITGNRVISDQDIFNAILLKPGDPLDTYQINKAREAIIDLYKKHGFYLVQVETDPQVLTESRIILFRVREGPRVKIKEIDFTGNSAFSTRQIEPLIKSRTSIFLLRTGELDQDTIDSDIASITRYYKDRGYLDVRVGRQIDVSNDLTEAKLTFLIDEGRLFTMRQVRVQGSTRLLPQQISALIDIKSGDVYSEDKIARSRQELTDALGRMGYVDARVDLKPTRDPDGPFVDLLITISEGQVAFTGEIKVKGNLTTQRKVILREGDVLPDRPLSTVGLAQWQQRLRETQLFNDIKITPLPPDPSDPLHRDVAVEVKEADTGNFAFGAAVNSDLGVFGQISLTQRNFDIADFPESFDELIHGRAFRGAGQLFNVQVQPGNEFSDYEVNLTEPYAFGTDTGMRTSIAYTHRALDSYDEERLGGALKFSRRIGRVWTGYIQGRYQAISLDNIEASAPVDVFDVKDQHIVTGLSTGVVRTTVDNRFRPSRGSRLALDAEQVGALGGDYNFTRLSIEHSVFFTIDEDFLGRKSVLSLHTQAGYEFGGTTPVYERFYLGGRSLRGFDYRSVSPKGIQHNNGKLGTDPVGGDWLFFAGVEYSFPIFEKMIGGVVFVDSGTVTDDPGFDDYRASVGAGLRLYIPQLGQAPLAFDFAAPFLSQTGDQKRVFSFSIDLPF